MIRRAYATFCCVQYYEVKNKDSAFHSSFNCSPTTCYYLAQAYSWLWSQEDG